jgi:Cu(I)/Ag(I) efflux system membrane fusion protein
MKNIIIICLFFLIGCSADNQSRNLEEHNRDGEQASAVEYTCPMHQNIAQEGPGACPVCGMDLEAVSRTVGDSTHDLMLSDSQIKLANVTTQRATIQSIGQTILVNGKLVENETLAKVVSSRAPGRIEKLYVKETGTTIQKGAPLYQLYSEVLLTLQQEYLLAKEQYESLGESEKRYKSFLDAAKEKLTLYGLTDRQIETLDQRKNVEASITFLSPTSGLVSEIAVIEGQYISEGTTLMKVEDTGQLWIEAELYPAETSLASIGDLIKVKIAGYEDSAENAVIEFLSPEYRSNSQITVVRGSIRNPQLKYLPGMQAQISFTQSSKKSLAIPVNAVIRDGKGTHVYIQRGHNTFSAQMVKTGTEDLEKIEITEGINEGDTVVITGAYLLYSELILKKGIDPMASHSH